MKKADIIKAIGTEVLFKNYSRGTGSPVTVRGYDYVIPWAKRGEDDTRARDKNGEVLPVPRSDTWSSWSRRQALVWVTHKSGRHNLVRPAQLSPVPGGDVDAWRAEQDRQRAEYEAKREAEKQARAEAVNRATQLQGSLLRGAGEVTHNGGIRLSPDEVETLLALQGYTLVTLDEV